MGWMPDDSPWRPEDGLHQAMRDILRHPLHTIVPAWSWKAAVLSAAFRAAMFFATNLRAGRHKAAHAMAVEACFAVLATGVLGATSQRLRHARPYWATALVVWLALPLAMVVAQFGIHRAAGTPYMGTGITLSFCFAAISSSFSWYAMGRGAMLGGDASTSVGSDVRLLPGIVRDYLMAVPRALVSVVMGQRRLRR